MDGQGTKTTARRRRRRARSAKNETSVVGFTQGNFLVASLMSFSLSYTLWKTLKRIFHAYALLSPLDVDSRHSTRARERASDERGNFHQQFSTAPFFSAEKWRFRER